MMMMSLATVSKLMRQTAAKNKHSTTVHSMGTRDYRGFTGLWVAGLRPVTLSPSPSSL